VRQEYEIVAKPRRSAAHNHPRLPMTPIISRLSITLLNPSPASTRLRHGTSRHGRHFSFVRFPEWQVPRNPGPFDSKPDKSPQLRCQSTPRVRSPRNCQSKDLEQIGVAFLEKLSWAPLLLPFVPRLHQSDRTLNRTTPCFANRPPSGTFRKT